MPYLSIILGIEAVSVFKQCLSNLNSKPNLKGRFLYLNNKVSF